MKQLDHGAKILSDFCMFEPPHLHFQVVSPIGKKKKSFLLLLPENSSSSVQMEFSSFKNLSLSYQPCNCYLKAASEIQQLQGLLLKAIRRK